MTLLALGLTLFFGVLTLQYFSKIYQSPHRSAFLRWSSQIQELCQGENIWEKHNYPNPPIMALLLAPLAHLPHLAGAMMWFGLKIVLVLAAIHWVWRMLEQPAPLPLWVKPVGLLLVLRPIEGDLVHGNVNLFILFLVTASLFAFTRGQDWLSGSLLGFAIACKLTPALFVPYFAWKRAWRTLAGCCLGLALFWGLVPGLCLGWTKNAHYLLDWVDNMVLPYVHENKVTSEHQNQSLPGLLHRLLTHSPSFSRRTETQYVPLEYHNLADLDPSAVQGLVKGVLGLFLLLVVWTCRTPITQRRHWRLVAEFGLVLLGMLLFSERTWKHHCATLLFPCAMIAWGMAQTTGTTRRAFAGCLIAAGALMTTTTSGLFPGHERLGDLALVYGAYVWAFLLLGAPLVYLLRNDVAAAELVVFQARISVTTEPETRGCGRPMRSVSSVSGSMPSK